jgi:DNA-binding PadR family transcriptional regulator
VTVSVRPPIHRQAIYDARVPKSPDASSAGGTGPPDGGSLVTFGRYAGPATLILSSLADGAKHGYALTKDIEQFAGVRLAPGTLYEALSRLEGQGLIEALASEDRRRPYQLTAAGAEALRAHLADQRRVADVGLRRLARSWGPA